MSLAASRNPEYNKNSALLHILPEIELLLAENKALRVLLLDFDLNSRSEVTAVLDLQRALASSYPTEGDIFRMICVVDEMPQEGITGTIVDSSLYILEQNSGTKPTLKPLKTPKGFENFKFPPVKPEAARKYTTDQRQLFELTNIVVESGDGFLRKDPHKKKTNRRAGQGNINDGLVARVTEIAEDWILSAQRRNGYTTFGHSPRPSHHQSIDNESVRIIPLQKPPARKSRPPSHSGFTIKPAEHYSSCPYQPRGLEVIVSLAEENASGGRNSYTQEYGKVKGLNIEPYCPSPSSQHTFLEDSDEEDARRNLLEEDDEDRIFTDDEYEEEGYCDSIEDYSIVVAKGYRPNSFHQRRSRCGKGHHSPEFSDNGDVTQYAWMSTDDHGRLKMKVMAAENGRYLGRAQGAGVGPRLRCAGTRLNPVINNIKAMKVLGLE